MGNTPLVKMVSPWLRGSPSACNVNIAIYSMVEEFDCACFTLLQIKFDYLFQHCDADNNHRCEEINFDDYHNKLMSFVHKYYSFTSILLQIALPLFNQPDDWAIGILLESWNLLFMLIIEPFTSKFGKYAWLNSNQWNRLSLLADES